MSDDINSIQRLEALNDEGLLENRPRLREHLKMLREFATATQELGSPRRSEAMKVAELDDEPTAGFDELGVVVLQDELGSQLANSPTTIGVSGSGAARTRWVWRGPGVGFIERRSFSSLSRDSTLRGRLVVLDPRGTSFDALLDLCARSSSRLHYVREVALAIVRHTTSIALLQRWAAHPDARDVQFRRVVLEQLERAEKAQAAE
jgi:hypothetical protein